MPQDQQTEEIYLTPELEQDLINRLSRMEGHLRAIRRMLEKHQSCNQMLIQMGAVKAALNQSIIKLLEGHMETCVTRCVAAGDLEELNKLKKALALVLKRS